MVSRCTRAAVLWAVFVFASATSSAAQEVDDPNAAAQGIYTECIMGMSWTCLQRKALLFIDRLGKSARFPLVGDGMVSLVRTSPPKPELAEESLRGMDSDSLGDLVDNHVYDFFQTHIFRFELPSWLKGSSDDQQRSDNALDFYLGDSLEEGRKKGGGGGGGGKMKGMKKMMMMMCMMAAGKFMMLGPMMMGMTKLMAMKALIMGIISLTISKIMILKKLKSKQMGGGSSGWSSGGSSGGWSSGGGGGGGSGWSSGGGGGGGGGWDRSFGSHDLAYKGQIEENTT